MVSKPAIAKSKTGRNIRCRCCRNPDLSLIVSLGQTPLANALISPDRPAEPEPTYPLDLAFCPLCSLAPITVTVPPETLFRRYPYFSSFSDEMVEHARTLTAKAGGTCWISSSTAALKSKAD